MKRLFLLLGLLPALVSAQSYTSYFTGNTTDTVTSPKGGICLMGGGGESDKAMQWFLQRADGGDILVLRTSGSDGYNDYLYTFPGLPVNSVETIVFNNPAASHDPYVGERIQKAEAIWLAGGDQWYYVNYWRNTPIDSLINLAISERNIVIGGTSAGMAILGGFYFTPQNGTITSPFALSNPFFSQVTVDSATFIRNEILRNVITDTHFDNPDRRGRLVTFLARTYTDYGVLAKGIACDEYTAICIDTNGLARVFGGFPTYDDNAYFIQTNCELADQSPETCLSGTPLTWDRGGMAIKVYHVKGTNNGLYSFDLNDWKTGTGGFWLNWSVSNGAFQSQSGNEINCPLSVNDLHPSGGWEIFPVPVPAGGSFIIRNPLAEKDDLTVEMYNIAGRRTQDSA
jgi:cyanophycinase-like exopeptidase